jgi:hypothetical protein
MNDIWPKSACPREALVGAELPLAVGWAAYIAYDLA